MVVDFEEVFKVSLRAMRIVRCDPAIRRDLKWMAQFVLIHSPYTFIFIVSIHNIICINAKDNDFPAICKNGVLVVAYVEITFGYSIMLWKQQHIMKLMDKMKRDYLLARFLSPEERDVVLQFAKQGEYVCKQWHYISFIGFLIFPIKTVLLTIYYWHTDSFRLVPLYDLIYPAFIEDRKKNLAVYFIIYLVLLEFAYYTATMYTAFVPIGPIFMLHACGQLEIVKKRIEGVFDHDVEEVELRLKDIILRLRYIYDFVDKTNVSFSVAYEMTLKGTSIMLPITIFEVLETLKVGEVSLEYLAFIIGSILISSSPCYYSDLLMEKGYDVRMAMYSAGWENSFDRRTRSTILIVLHRALRPVAVQSLLRTLSLHTLTDVFQQAYTIFNLMNAMWE